MGVSESMERGLRGSARVLFLLVLLAGMVVGDDAIVEQKPEVEFVQPEKEANIRPCTILYGNSFDEAQKLPGQSTRIKIKEGQEITVFDPQAKKRLKIKLADVRVLRQTIREQQEEKEWRWKEGGSNEKLLTGRFYYWRKFGMELVLDDGKKVSGVLASGFMVRYEVDGKWKKLVIKTRDKSPMLEKGSDPKKDPKFLEYRMYLKEITFLVPVLKNVTIR